MLCECFFSQQPLSCDWWNLQGNKCSSVAGALCLRHGALQLFCSCHEPLGVLCATCSPEKSIIFPCFMHDLIILAVHWVSLNVHLDADMSGILFYLLRMAVFLFPETYKSAAEPSRYLTWKRLSRFSPWHQKTILLFTFIKQTRKSPERVYACYGYMCRLHSDLCSIWQEARQHMAQAAGELHVSGVAVLEDKPGFPSCHVQSLGSASAFTVPEIRCIRQCCSAARPHLFAPSLYRKTPPPNQLKACIPLRLHVLQTQ